MEFLKKIKTITMQIKLKNQTENGKFTEVRFVGYPNGKDHFAYREDIAPQFEFLKRSGIINDQVKIILEAGYDKKLSERGPLYEIAKQEYTAIDQDLPDNYFEKEYVKVSKSKIKYANVYKEPHGDEIGMMFKTPTEAQQAAGLSDTYYKTLKIIDE
jgi:hypothetical protein